MSKLTRGAYVPRASTPLLDAMGRGINDLESKIGKMAEGERPEKVIMAVITDGQENASREFRKDQVEKMIKERTEKDGWQFVFLSADLEAIRDAIATGFRADTVLGFSKTAEGTRGAYHSLSKQMSGFRSGKKKLEFDEEDKKSDAELLKKKPN